MENNQLEQFKKMLVHKRSPIKKDIQLKIINVLFDTFIQYDKNLLFLYGGKIAKITSRRAFETNAFFYLSIVFEDIELKSYDEDKEKYKWNIKISEIYDVITSVNSYDLLVYESDLFLGQQEIRKDDFAKTITVVTNKLHIKEIKQPSIKQSDYNEIIKDYKQHFKYFDELIDLIIDMRLAKDRKASFLHLRVKSNWGKSFLSGLFQNLQIGFEIDYHNLMNKGANDIAPIQVRNSFVLILDEFNNFSAEMKKLSHDFKFAPKFGMSEKVELYLKILMSAEKSPSFGGGVDDQIVNRVMVMDISDNEAVALTNRAIYKKYGNAKYMVALERYTYLKLMKRLEHYLSMEKFEAHKLADKRVNKALDRYRMKDVSNLNDEVKFTINDTIHEILESSDIDLNPRFRDIRKNIIELKSGRFAGKIFIKQPKKTFEIILKNTVSESEFKKMKWKLSDLSNIVNLVSNKPQFINNKTQKGLVIDIEDTIEAETTSIKNHQINKPTPSEPTIHVINKEDYEEELF